MIDHLSIQVRDVEASRAFYDKALAPLGARRMLEFGQATGYGVTRPTFWIGPLDECQPAANRQVHVAFEAPDRATVIAFTDEAVAHGAELLHAPRVWTEYHTDYFGGFVRDPDGNNVEAVCHLPE
jgi:catechol 2,3-dioxygenase-like lactoylglutathione lyase family enzyme